MRLIPDGEGKSILIVDLKPERYNNTSDNLIYNITVEEGLETDPRIPNTTGRYKMWVEVRVDWNTTKDVEWNYMDTNNDSKISTGDKLVLQNASRYFDKDAPIVFMIEEKHYASSAEEKIKKPKSEYLKLNNF